MTTIQKLQFSGIRSYDPKTPVVVNFKRPLTLFIGKNGSGKTTIIEALRFVCTGQNPPDSLKGKSFVHDPLLTGESIVKAQIKLTLRTFDNKPVTIIRSFQLSQTAKSRRYQQIDATIRSVNEEGEKITATHKCLEIDNIAAQIMKVSKAIISNVIFCHQEESLWPMSDSKTLKLKFDDIFASTRYTRALDKIKSIRKKLRTKTALLEKDLVIEKNHLESYKKAKADLENLTKEIVLLDETLERLNKDVAWNNSKLKRLSDKLQRLKDVERDLASLQFESDGIKRELCSLERDFGRFGKMEETSEKLELLRNQKTREKGDLENRIGNSEKLIEKCENELLGLKNEYEKNIHNIGKMQAEEERNEFNLKELSREAEDLARKYDFRVAGGSDVEQGEIVEGEMGDFLCAKNKKLIDLTDRFSFVEEDLRKRIESKQSSFAAEQQMLSHLKNGIYSTENRIKETAEKLKENRSLQTSALKAKNQLNVIKKRLKEFETKTDAAEAGEKIKRVESAVDQLNQKYRSVEMELDLLRIESSAEEKIKLKTAELQRKQAELKQSLQNSISLFSEISDETLSASQPEDFSRLYADFASEKFIAFEKRRNAFRKRLKEQQDSFGECSGKLMITKNDVGRLKAEITRKRRSVSSDIDLTKIDDLLEENQRELNKWQSKIIFEKGAVFVYKKLIEKITANQNCPVCEKKLFKKDSLRVISKMEEKIASFEENAQTQRLDKNVAEIKKRLAEMKKVLPVKRSIESLEKGLAKKDARLGEYRRELEARQKRVDEGEKERKKLEGESVRLKRILADSEDLLALFRDVSADEKWLEQEKYRLKTAFGGKADYATLKKERDEINKKLSDENKNLSKLRAEKEMGLERKNRFFMEMSELREKESKSFSLKEEEKRLVELKKQHSIHLKEMKAKVLKKEKLLKTEENLIGENKREWKIISTEFKIDKSGLLDEIKSAEGEKTKFGNLLETIKRYESLQADRNEIMKYFDKNKALKISLEHKVEKMAASKKATEVALIQTTSLLNSIKGTLLTRLKEAEHEKITLKIQNSQKERTHIVTDEKVPEIFKLESEKMAELKRLYFEAEGRKSAFKDQAIDTSNSIKSNESFDRVEEKYNETLFALETNLLAFRDLEIYQKALDNALIEFHSMKMREINQILKKYWKLVYRGNDIDHIEIVSNCSDGSAAAKPNRTYNYFVVMVKEKISLEMRGRCSAGQKVLASLLIRLSLAETFCTNCNVLALDEPTTNLDEENARSFGESLNQLIQSKRSTGDFQLILITHNEAFAELLGKKNLVEGFYRVAKNARNFSKIQKADFD